MKKITLLVIALVFTMVALAQQNRPEFGLKGGVSLADLKTNANDLDVRTGWHVGGLAHFHLNRHFALQPELIYSSQGAKLGTNNTQKINYVNLPVLGQYLFGNGLRLQTGPQIGYMVNSKADNGHGEVNIDDNFRKTDFSWSFGAGYLTRSGIGIDARYNLGINDISKNNTNIKNSVWQFGIFYQFRK